MKKYPLISVLMPVYNAEKYLSEAIESILNQTFTDFEFLIINDGSTDKSRDIICSYNDKRIRLIDNKENKGIIFSLNNGIDNANGSFIARMDADDISMPDRFEKQVLFLESNQKSIAVFTNIELINPEGIKIGYWNDDIIANNYDAICQILPKSNCLAHPTVMIKKDVIKAFKYKSWQYGSEDWDLWLRLVSKNYRIEKINEFLIQYRVHPDSVSFLQNKKGIDLKIIKFQIKHILIQLMDFKFNSYTFKVVKNMLLRIDSYYFKEYFIKIYESRTWIVNKVLKVKQNYQKYKLIDILIKNVKPDKSKKRILFFVNMFGFGGAEKVVLDIISNIDKNKFQLGLIATNSVADNIWKNKFYTVTPYLWVINDCVPIDMQPKFILKLIKRFKVDLIVINNSIQGYESIGFIKQEFPNIKITDIMHGEGGHLEGGGMPEFSFPFRDKMDRRITISNYLKNHLISNYKIQENQIDVIHNGIAISDDNINSKTFDNLHTLYNLDEDSILIAYIGRFGYEKHPEIFLEIAKWFEQNQYVKLSFLFIGNGEHFEMIKNRSIDYNLKNTVFTGYIDPEILQSYLHELNMVVMTSEAEGIPLVLLECLSTGMSAISTNVGGVPEIIIDDDKGILIDFNDAIVPSMIDAILQLIKSGRYLQKSDATMEFIRQEFSTEMMTKKYETTFMSILT